MLFGQLNEKLEVARERAQGEQAFEVTGRVKANRKTEEIMNGVHGMAKVTCAWWVVEE